MSIKDGIPKQYNSPELDAVINKYLHYNKNIASGRDGDTYFVRFTKEYDDFHIAEHNIYLHPVSFNTTTRPVSNNPANLWNIPANAVSLFNYDSDYGNQKLHRPVSDMKEFLTARGYTHIMVTNGIVGGGTLNNINNQESVDRYWRGLDFLGIPDDTLLQKNCYRRLTIDEFITEYGNWFYRDTIPTTEIVPNATLFWNTGWTFDLNTNLPVMAKSGSYYYTADGGFIPIEGTGLTNKYFNVFDDFFYNIFTTADGTSGTSISRSGFSGVWTYGRDDVIYCKLSKNNDDYGDDCIFYTASFYDWVMNQIGIKYSSTIQPDDNGGMTPIEPTPTPQPYEPQFSGDSLPLTSEVGNTILAGLNNNVINTYYCELDEVYDLVKDFYRQVTIFPWENRFLDTILSLRAVQYVVNDLTDTKQPITYGNGQVTDVAAYQVTQQYTTIEYNPYKFENRFNSFLDFSPYTKIDMYIPFIGFREIKPLDVMGCWFKLKYIIDNISGTFTVQGMCAADELMSTNVRYIFNYSSRIGSDVPLTAQNFDNLVSNATGLLMNASGTAFKNPVSIGANAISSLVGSQVSVEKTGSLVPDVAGLNTLVPYIIFTRPIVNRPEWYNKQVGRPCETTGLLGQFSGYTVVKDVHIEKIDTTQQERNMIDSILKSGVVI